MFSRRGFVRTAPEEKAMRVAQFQIPAGLTSISSLLKGADLHSSDLVLVFGSTERFKHAGIFNMLRSEFPKAVILGCTTAGEILGTRVLDDSIVVSAIKFDSVRVRASKVTLSRVED